MLKTEKMNTGRDFIVIEIKAIRGVFKKQTSLNDLHGGRDKYIHTNREGKMTTKKSERWGREAERERRKERKKER